ncbi:hypothetical protein JHK87_043029 [Glycine soja]|nr:hypothetical protein JHK87_043029 [Glycine soja]
MQQQITLTKPSRLEKEGLVLFIKGFVLVLLKIVHTNIKATNVLPDKDLNPEISDFGLAKLDDGDKTHLSTRIASTLLLSHFQRSKALKWSFPLLSIKDFNIKEAMVMINVALLCTKVSPALRPTMSSVVSMHEGRTIIQEVVSDTREVLDDKKYEIMRQYYQNRGENNLIDS